MNVWQPHNIQEQKMFLLLSSILCLYKCDSFKLKELSLMLLYTTLLYIVVCSFIIVSYILLFVWTGLSYVVDSMDLKIKKQIK